MKRFTPIFNVLILLSFVSLQASALQKFQWYALVELLFSVFILSVESFVFFKRQRKYNNLIIVFINVIFFFELYMYVPTSFVLLKMHYPLTMILLILTAVINLFKVVIEVVINKKAHK